MPERDNNFHSQEAQQILGKTPSWVVRWGITIIFIIFMGIVLGCYFIKSPDTVQAPVEITTINPPVDLIARYQGLIDTICVSNNSTVSKGGLIAVLSNSADYSSVCMIEGHLREDAQLPLCEVVNQPWLEQEYPVGMLQSAYADFRRQCLDYRQYIETSYIPTKKTLLEEQISKNEQYYSHLRAQQKIEAKDMAYERLNLNRDSLLYAESVISQADYHTSIRNLLSKESAQKGFDATFSSTELSIIQIRQQLVELSLQEQNEKAEYERNLSAARQQLLSQISQWREQYVILSPSDGTVSLLNYWTKNQWISANERMATVIPDGKVSVIGRMRVPTAGFGKVMVGQMVNVKLNGWPYMEYGVLKGMIESISAVPDLEKAGSTPSYIVELRFPGGLKTSYNRELPMIQQMDGTGEIITQDKRLIQQFIQPILSLFKNQ